MKTALVTIASPLEKNYINEWIKYHHSLGFDDIFVYTNNWRMTLESSYVHGPFNDQLYDPDKFPYIAHFFCKSLEEYRQRRSRGRPDLPSDSADFIRPETQFWDHDKNEVECLELYNLFRRIV